MAGLYIRGIGADITFRILDRLQIQPSILISLQRFEEQYKFEPHYPDCEKLYLLDAIQRVFTDDGKGNGTLIPSELVAMTEEWKDFPGQSLAILYWKALLVSVNHPDRKETMDTGEKQYNHLKNLYKQTPWTLYEKGTTYNEQENRMIKKNFFLNYGKNTIPSFIELYYRFNVKADALVTTLAVLKYKADKGQFPQQLDELILGGYLKNLPMDPYSDRPLVYKRTEDNFILYSVGANFKDDGGVHSDNWEQDDYVFWPTLKLTRVNFMICVVPV